MIEVTETDLINLDTDGSLTSLLGDNDLAQKIENGSIDTEAIQALNLSIPQLAVRVEDLVLHPPLTKLPGNLTLGISLENVFDDIAQKLDDSAKETLENLDRQLQELEDIGLTESSDNELSRDIISGLISGSFNDLTEQLENISVPEGGSPNVIIGGKSAWRALIDIHFCPIHGPSVVIEGSTSVFINGFPASRMLDELIEFGGSTNLLIQGEPTVIIGNSTILPE